MTEEIISILNLETAAGLVEMRVDQEDQTLAIIQYIDGWNDPILITLDELGELYQLAKRNIEGAPEISVPSVQIPSETTPAVSITTTGEGVVYTTIDDLLRKLITPPYEDLTTEEIGVLLRAHPKTNIGDDLLASNRAEHWLEDPD
jgi:hypothetical protein